MTMVHAPAEAEYLVLTHAVASRCGLGHRARVLAWLDLDTPPSADGARRLDPVRGYQAECSCGWQGEPRGDMRIRQGRGGAWYDAEKAARTDLSRHLAPPRPPRKTDGPRDSQRARVYAAERSIDGQPWDTGFRSLQDTQAWLDAFLASRWFQARWGRMDVAVEAGSGCHAHYRGGITLNRWGRRPLVVLHELAHVLVSSPDVAAHGPLFAACLCSLVDAAAGPDAGRLLRAAYRDHRVRYRTALADLPAPTRPVTTKKARQERARARAAAPVSPSEAAAAARVLDRLIRSGAFGPAGRKPRDHALATARALRKLADGAPPAVHVRKV